MIDRIIVENFKSLRRIDLTLGRMNLFVGANASGKSNFLDAAGSTVCWLWPVLTPEDGNA